MLSPLVHTTEFLRSSQAQSIFESVMLLIEQLIADQWLKVKDAGSSTKALGCSDQ